LRGGGIVLANVFDNRGEVVRCFRRPSNKSSGGENPVYLAAHISVGDELAGVERGQTFIHFSLKPGIVVNVVCD
jgi:hypothetical protein